MKKKLRLSMFMIFLVFIFVGFPKQTKENISLDIWHYYKDIQQAQSTFQIM